MNFYYGFQRINNIVHSSAQGVVTHQEVTQVNVQMLKSISVFTEVAFPVKSIHNSSLFPSFQPSAVFTALPLIFHVFM